MRSDDLFWDQKFTLWSLEIKLNNFSKELLEITHACGYEHPSQFTMNDVNIGQGDNNETCSLASTYGYQKDPVIFDGYQEIVDCPHLGGNYTLKKVDKSTVRY